MTTAERFTPPEAQQEFREKEKNIKVFKPATEYLLNPQDPESPWPEEIKNNPELKQLAEKRRELSVLVRAIFERIPDPTKNFTEALKEKQVTPKELADLYDKLTELLSDPDYGRLILYLPFELLPEKNLKTKSKPLAESAKHFSEVYMQRWHEQLEIFDIPANFKDGNIPEPEIRSEPLPRVAKAGHLAVKLVEKNYLSHSDVIKLIVEAKDPIQKQSLADTLLILNEQNPFSEELLKQLEESGEDVLVNLKSQIESVTHTQHSEKPKLEKTNLAIKFQTSLAELSTRYERNLTNLPKARADWLRLTEENAILEQFAEALSESLKEGNLTPEQISGIANTEGKVYKLLVIKTLGKTLESKPQNTEDLLKRLEPLLEQIQKTGDLEIQDSLLVFWSRLHSLGLVDENSISQKGFKIPKLDSAFSIENSQVEKEISELNEMIKTIEENPELSKFIYPIAIMYGSKVKGYGKITADVDIAIFIKPGIPSTDKPQIEKLLKTHFGNHKAEGEAMQFWLYETEEELNIQDFPTPDNHLGDSSLSHVLLGGVWVGNTDSIKEIYKKTLPGFLHPKDKKIENQPARRIWLEAMERDTLQYRLLHKGYERFHPAIPGVRSKHKAEVDGESTFWDPGYRRLATKLFIDKVLLPDLSK